MHRLYDIQAFAPGRAWCLCGYLNS